MQLLPFQGLLISWVSGTASLISSRSIPAPTADQRCRYRTPARLRGSRTERAPYPDCSRGEISLRDGRINRSRRVDRETGTVPGNRTWWFASRTSGPGEGPAEGAGQAPGAVVLPWSRPAVPGEAGRLARALPKSASTGTVGTGRTARAGPGSNRSRPTGCRAAASAARALDTDDLLWPDGRRRLQDEPLGTSGEITRS